MYMDLQTLFMNKFLLATVLDVATLAMISILIYKAYEDELSVDTDKGILIAVLVLTVFLVLAPAMGMPGDSNTSILHSAFYGLSGYFYAGLLADLRKRRGVQ